MPPRWWLALGTPWEPFDFWPEDDMRHVRRIILHCSATPEGRDVSVDEIRRWHVEGNGWSDIGYHAVVALDGTIHPGRPEETAGAHVQGHNADSLGLCYVGGVDAEGGAKDTRTAQQIEAMDSQIDRWRREYGQHLTVHGHNEFARKACPSFNVQEDRRLRRR